MKKLFIILTLLFACNAFAVNIGPCAMTVAGRCFSQAEVARFESGTTGVTLIGFVTTTGRFSPLYDSTGAVYQVPVGKTLKFVAGRFSQNSSTITGGIQFGKCDDAATHDDTACTNVAYQMGAASLTFQAAYSPTNDATQNEFYLGTGYDVAASKYPIVAAYGNLMAVTVYCYLN